MKEASAQRDVRVEKIGETIEQSLAVGFARLARALGERADNPEGPEGNRDEPMVRATGTDDLIAAPAPASPAGIGADSTAGKTIGMGDPAPESGPTHASLYDQIRQFVDETKNKP